MCMGVVCEYFVKYIKCVVYQYAWNIYAVIISGNTPLLGNIIGHWPVGVLLHVNKLL